MEKKLTYGVWAVRSSTSIFGPAQSLCKENGKPLEFDRKADAENYAKEANEHTTANVRYYAELYEEGQTGNYNMLDGRLNNEPPVRPDLTDGQTDEEIRELVPEAKPSLMDRLKADKPEHEARQMIPPVPERER